VACACTGLMQRFPFRVETKILFTFREKLAKNYERTKPPDKKEPHWSIFQRNGKLDN
jgi:hypothetical protein